MGCGCGGSKNRNNVRSGAPSQSSQSGVRASQLQAQSNQRQALIQQAKERLQQQANVETNTLSAQQRDVERKRRIQVSLRNRNGRTQGNQ